jgi:hypothetical protein
MVVHGAICRKTNIRSAMRAMHGDLPDEGLSGGAKIATELR